MFKSLGSNNQQDEEALLCRVATSRKPADGLQLMDSPGWATLVTILQESGERPPKRPWSDTTQQHRTVISRQQHDPSSSSSSSSLKAGNTTPTSERLAKRFKGASLE